MGLGKKKSAAPAPAPTAPQATAVNNNVPDDEVKRGAGADAAPPASQSLLAPTADEKPKNGSMLY